MIPLNQIHVTTPCTENWDAMDGDAQTRFCAGCGCHFHNLSALSRSEAQALLERTDAKLCIRYQPDTDGHPQTREKLGSAKRIRIFGRHRLAAAFSWIAALLLAGWGSLARAESRPRAGSVPAAAHHPRAAQPKPPRVVHTMGIVAVRPLLPPPPLMGAPAPPPATTGKVAPPSKK